MATKKTPRATKGVGWTRVEAEGEWMLRYHRCEKLITPNRWWHHGTDESPCQPTTESK